MSTPLSITLQAADWLDLFRQYLMLSLLSIGGGISTVPEMHRFLVEQHGWLTDTQFNASIALAQAAPGPNILFVALMGWNLGMNAGGIATALFGVLVTMSGIMLPSTTLTYLAAQWAYRNRTLRAVRAFKQGMAPLVVALLVTTGWILASAYDDPATDWGLWLVSIATALILGRVKIHLLWLLGAGALLGAFGLV